MNKVQYKNLQSTFITEKAVAHPEDRQAIVSELIEADSIGETRAKSVLQSIRNEKYTSNKHRNTAVLLIFITSSPHLRHIDLPTFVALIHWVNISHNLVMHMRISRLLMISLLTNQIHPLGHVTFF